MQAQSRSRSRLALTTLQLHLRILDEPVAVVVGAEGRGVSKLVAERCDVVARLPMADGVESLNASVAAALAMFEVARARGTLS